MFVMMNAARLAVGTQGVAIAERAYQQALAFARDRRQGRSAEGRRRHGADHRAPRRAAHADDDEGLRPRGARHLPPDRRRARPREPRADRGGARGRRQSRGAAHPDRQGVLDRPRRRGDLDRRPDPRRHGLHRGDRAPPSTCAIPASPRSTKAPTAFTASTSCCASCRSPAARPSATRSRWIRDVARAVSERGGAAFGATAARLVRGRGRARRVDPRHAELARGATANSALAGASPYLRLFGLTLGGACLAKAGLAAAELAASGNSSELARVGARPLLRREAAAGRAGPEPRSSPRAPRRCAPTRRCLADAI